MINDQPAEGATPLSPDDLNGMIPKGITTREQLNQFEALNIQQALIWARRARTTPATLLTIDYCLNLHKRMFNKTWRWAGQFRRYEVNIGNTPPEQIPMALRNCCDDAKAWLEYDSYPKDEIAIRLHHRLVWIHPFTNGNGRHTRIMADLLLTSLGQPIFSWGKLSLTQQSENRKRYLAALREADKGDYQPLLAFAKS